VEREFIESRSFSIDWNALHQSDDKLRALQNYLARHPAIGPIIENTGGMRKIRWVREGTTGGKSGGLRIIYWDDEKGGVIFLVAVFGKNEKSDLTETEKKALKMFIKTL
jgi:hypothetical protein